MAVEAKQAASGRVKIMKHEEAVEESRWNLQDARGYNNSLRRI